VAVLSEVDLAGVELVDGHCHHVTTETQSPPEFRRWCTESAQSGESTLDSQLGLAIRRWCAPVLGLPDLAPMSDYLDARRKIGGPDASARLLRAARLTGLLVDTGLSSDGMTTIESLSGLAGAPAHEVVRLEALAESIVDGSDAASFAVHVREALDGAYAGGAVAAKSIAAYRHGLDLDPARPDETAVRAAAGAWMREQESGARRVADPVLLRHLLWCAVDAGRPIQVHTGFGDSDASLVRANPAWLQPFCDATERASTPIVLLHCYPYHRLAGWLAHVYPHVYIDVGLAVGYVGARATALLGEFLELAPFGKILYSSDAYGLAELYQVGAAQFRHSLARVLSGFVDDGAMTVDDAFALATSIGSGNARRLYG